MVMSFFWISSGIGGSEPTSKSGEKIDDVIGT
jgi:hypothetical protein